MGLVHQPVYSGVGIGEGSRHCVSVKDRKDRGAGDDVGRIATAAMYHAWTFKRQLRHATTRLHVRIQTAPVDTLHSGRAERRRLFVVKDHKAFVPLLLRNIEGH